MLQRKIIKNAITIKDGKKISIHSMFSTSGSTANDYFSFSDKFPTQNHNLFKNMEERYGEMNLQEEEIVNNILGAKNCELFIKHLELFGSDFLFALNNERNSAFDCLSNFFNDYQIGLIADAYYKVYNLENELKIQSQNINLSTIQDKIIKKLKKDFIQIETKEEDENHVLSKHSDSIMFNSVVDDNELQNLYEVGIDGNDISFFLIL